MVISRQAHRQGFILLFVVFILMLLVLLVFDVASVETVDARMAGEAYRESRALGLARSGVMRAVCELSASSTWATDVPVSAPMMGGTYTVGVWASPANPSTGVRLWKVTSTGAFETARRSVECWMHQETFARYAYFTDAERTTGGQTIYFVTADHITGPTHTNGYFSIAGTPSFSSHVTSSNASDPFFNTTARTYTQGGRTSSDPSAFYHYYTSYSQDRPTALDNSPTFSFNGGQPAIELPSSSGTVSAAADVRIYGNATMTFQSNGTVLVQQSGSRDVTWSTAATTFYVSGKAVVKGTVAGVVTLGATNGIEIPDNLIYRDRARDLLGLVSDTNVTVTTSSSQRRDLEIDASIMAINGSFTVQSYDSGGYRGVLHVFGGITQHTRGAVGTFSGTGTISSGYSKDYVYDERLMNVSPPNFPITGRLVVGSFVDRGALGY